MRSYKKDYFLRVVQMLLLMFLLISTHSCAALKSSKDSAFDETIKVDNLNDKIRLSYIKGYPEPRMGETVTILAKNRSSESVIFPNDFGIEIYRYDEIEKHWVKVNNRGEYFSSGGVGLAPANSGGLYYRPVSFYPELPPDNKPIEIRVCVIGHVIEDQISSKETVGACMDVLLEP